MDRMSICAPIETTSSASRGKWLSGIGTSSMTPVQLVCPLHCHSCGGYSIAVFDTDQAGGNHISQGPHAAGGVENTTVTTVAIFPKPEHFGAPDAVPKNAGQLFVEAKEDLRSGRTPAGIIGKCRSILDVCLTELKAEGQGRKTRIADLHTKGILTKTLADWAQKLWDDGNPAIHEIIGDEDSARQHVAFLDLFFEVAFVLPAQVEAAKGGPTPASEEEGAAAASSTGSPS
jgi:hypothetical protein